MLDLPGNLRHSIAEGEAGQGAGAVIESSKKRINSYANRRGEIDSQPGRGVERGAHAAKRERLSAKHHGRNNAADRSAITLFVAAPLLALVVTSVAISYLQLRQSSYCKKETGRLNRLAREIPAYQTQNGEMYFTEPSGIVIPPWKAAATDDPYRPIWESVYFVLTSIIHTTPLKQTAEQSAFIKAANSYLQTCGRM